MNCFETTLCGLEAVASLMQVVSKPLLNHVISLIPERSETHQKRVRPFLWSFSALQKSDRNQKIFYRSRPARTVLSHLGFSFRRRQRRARMCFGGLLD